MTVPPALVPAARLLSLLTTAILTGCSSLGGGDDALRMSPLPHRGEQPSWSGPGRERVMRDVLPGLKFTGGEWRIPEEELSKVKTVAEYMQANAVSVLLAAGADTRSREYSRQLGQQRAGAVRLALISEGIAPSAISIVSYGPDLPAASRDRVEFGFIRNGSAEAPAPAGNPP